MPLEMEEHVHPRWRSTQLETAVDQSDQLPWSTGDGFVLPCLLPTTDSLTSRLCSSLEIMCSQSGGGRKGSLALGLSLV